MVTKKHNKQVLIDLDEMESMIYRNFYPTISHKNNTRIIQQMEIMDKQEQRIEGGNN